MSGGDGGDDDGDALARAEATLLRKYFYTLYTVQRFRERARRGAGGRASGSVRDFELLTIELLRVYCECTVHFAGVCAVYLYAVSTNPRDPPEPRRGILYIRTV